MVSTLAGGFSRPGFLDGPLSLAQFNYPWDICDDGLGNIFVADGGNYRIRLVNLNTNEGWLLPSFHHLISSFLFKILFEIYIIKFQLLPGTGPWEILMVLL